MQITTKIFYAAMAAVLLFGAVDAINEGRRDIGRRETVKEVYRPGPPATPQNFRSSGQYSMIVDETNLLTMQKGDIKWTDFITGLVIGAFIGANLGLIAALFIIKAAGRGPQLKPL